MAVLKVLLGGLQGFHDFASVSKSAYGAGTSAYQEDWLGFGANLGAGVGKTMYWARNQIPFLKNKLSAIKPTPTYIIDLTMVAVQLTDFINGFAVPDRGQDFEAGSDRYETLELLLQAAVPDARDWDGDAAQAYAETNAALQVLAQTMQELDAQMKTLLSEYGDRVQDAHTYIAVLVMSLVFAQGIALFLFMIPVYGKAISFGFQVLTAFTAITLTLINEDMTRMASESVAQQVDALTGEYEKVTASATQLVGDVTVSEMQKSLASVQGQLAATPESRVGSFQAISTSMSGIPDVATLVNRGVAEDERQLIDLLMSGEGLAVDSPDEGADDSSDQMAEASATSATSAAATLTLPTMAQMTAWSEQAAKFSGNLAQHMNLVNQTVGSVQSLASMAQQGQGAAAPAEEAADAGAEGAEGAERAPVDAAAGQEPGPAERVL